MRPQNMGSGNRQTERQISTEDVDFKRRRSFSWDKAFFTNEGFLDAEELSSMIEGGGDDVKYELEEIDEIESLEAKLFEEIEASKQKSGEISNLTKSSIKVASGKKDSQPKKVTGPVGPCRAAPIKPQSTSGGSPGNNVKSSATVSKRSIGSKTGKATTDSPSKTPPGTKTKNKMAPVITRLPRTSPSSPISPGSSGSSSSASAVNQQSKRGSRRSLVNNEKPSATNGRRQDDLKTGKPLGGLILKATSSIRLKNKPPPLNSHPTSPLGLCNSSSSNSTTQRPSESSLSTSTVDQRSKARRGRGTSVHSRSLNNDASDISTLKIHPTNQIPDRQGKQPADSGLKAGSSTRSSVQSTGRGMPASKGKSSESLVLPGMSKTDATQHSKSGSPNGAKARKPSPIKMVPNSQKTSMPKTSQRQSSVTAKRSISASRGAQNIFLISPEVLDIKGKINALKMEIDMQKKDRCKEIKKISARSGKGDTTSNLGSIQMNRT